MVKPASCGSSARVDFGFNNFVTMKGGEYFFCPSITRRSQGKRWWARDPHSYAKHLVTTENGI